ncbi:hypothetical protein EYS14_22660 [Alteromonadaceae bacterium M269]|nr:hypothetical protein EYS14_22660 [Alteromonadaceae bacterium M269]
MTIQLNSLLFVLLLTFALISSTYASSAKQKAQQGTPIFKRSGAAPLFDFGGVQADMQSQPTQVLVLGTTHLSRLPKEKFNKSHLSIVLDKIQEFAPDVVAIEAVGGRTCDEITRYKALYPDVQNYCSDNSAALNILGMTRPEAAAEIEKTLDEWPEVPTASDRRRLTLLFFGAGESWSGILQWAKLKQNERVAKDGITDELVERFNRGLNSPNENNIIGVELAQRLELDKLTMMDDHTADYIYLNAPEKLWSVVQSVWKKEHPREKEIEDLQQQFWGSAERVKNGYIFINSKDYQRFVIENDFGLATASPEEQGLARQYVAWWQVRGLRMVANVLEAAGNKPGAKVLVIVGASHKSYFDLYLDQMHDIEIIDIKEVFGD